MCLPCDSRSLPQTGALTSFGTELEPMNDPMKRRQPPSQPRPLVVELVGPAGSGKTTLARALCRRAGIAEGIELPRREHLPHAVRHGLLLLPAYLRVGGDGGWLTWKEMRSMTYLRAWPHHLDRPPTERAITVLDHGPVFRLARLRAHGPRITRSAAFERWWQQSLELWTGLLDVVVSLDAPDELLVDRIRLNFLKPARGFSKFSFTSPLYLVRM